MAKNYFKNVDVIQIPTKRKMINQLPGVLHTQTLQNFISGTLDHLFQPALTEKVSGYIGQKPTYYNLDKEFYVPETQQERKIYQFETTAISKDSNNNITNSIFFADILKELKFQGANTTNHNRLFQQNYYSWCPPINLDMFVNYSQYFWLEQGPEPTLIKSSTNVDQTLVGKDYPADDDAVFGLNGSVKLSSGMRIILLSDSNPAYNGKTFAVEGVGKSIKLIEFTEADISSTPWDLMPWDMFDWDISTSVQPDYITMERGCSDSNPWSKNNFWYHRDVLLASGSSIFENIVNQAKRPIICFEREMELYNYGSFRRSSVDLFDNKTSSLGDFENFRPDVLEKWVLVSVDGGLRFINENNGVSYQQQIEELKLQYSDNPEKVQIIRNGSKILFTGIEDDTTKNNKAYLVRFDNPVEAYVVRPWDANPWDYSYWENNNPDDINSYSEVITGYLRFIEITDGQNNQSEATYGDILKVRYGDWQGKEFWFNGSAWTLAQEKKGTNQPPLFNLYDSQPDSDVGIPLDDEIRYPSSSFAGNKVFGYSINPDQHTSYDKYVEEKLVYNQWGDIEFTNYLVKDTYNYSPSKYNVQEIEGYYFWKVKPNFYGNNWWRSDKLSKQFIVDTFNFNSNINVKYTQSFASTPNQSIFIIFNIIDSVENTRVVVDGQSVPFTINKNDNTIILNEALDEGKKVVVYLYDQPKTNLEFDISQQPDADDGNIKNIIVELNGKSATIGEHYCLINTTEFDNSKPIKRIAVLKAADTNNPNIAKGMSIEVKTYSSTRIDINDVSGYYEVPSNLSLNADWGDVTTVTADQYLEHFGAILSNQTNFSGSAYSQNNWRDTPQNRSLGNKIIQHTAPMLRLMILNSEDDLNYMKASRYVEREYNRFKNKFLQKLNKMWVKNVITDAEVSGVVDQILEELRLGKVFKEFPFSYSTMAGSNWFIPPTPSFLGLYPVFKPEKYIDTTYQNPRYVVVGHDGSVLNAWNDGRDDILLELETRIFNSIPEQYKSEASLPFNNKQYIPGKFRKHLTDYSREEVLEIEQPLFERWISENQQKYKQHNNFDYSNAWTYNYSSTSDNDGEQLPGYWRGIYQWFFDTDRPHTHPWEMLGFSMKPEWWENYYGPAPYTRGNTVLWSDLEQGIIRDGTRKGTDIYFARPGLINILPIDSSGNLIDPWTAGIVSTKPNFNNAKQPWAFGDGSPVESVWRKTSQFAFAQSQLGYLLKPVLWIEKCWNPLNDTYIYGDIDSGQLIRTTTLKRNQHSDFVVHGETIDGNVVVGSGYQQWISDRLMSSNKSIQLVFGNKIRGAAVQLGYKVGGFCNKYSFYADNVSGPLPAENIQQFLYRSPSIREEMYSGVIIEWTGRSYKVHGYDVINPVFNIIPGDKFGKSVTHNVGGTFVSNPPMWRSGTEYKVGNFVEYNGLFYEAIQNHISTFDFNATQWIQTSLKTQLYGVSVTESLEPVFDKKVVAVPYGTEFSSRQDMFDFIIDYQRYLVSKGWVFDDIDTETNEQKDFTLFGKKFVVWSLERDKPVGDYIKLSPFGTHAQFQTEFGSVQSVEQIVNGVYSIIDQDGFIIEPYETTVMRGDGNIDINVIVENKELYALRLYISEIEHVFLFDNKTVFDDLVYDPLFGQRQLRLKADGWRTKAWTGRLDAPGFVVTANTIIPNFEKTATEFLRLYSIENATENKQLFEQSAHLIGYQNRSYLQNMLVSSTTGLQFYQGMLHAKGSRGSMTRLFRSEFINESRDMNIHEEWAFRIGSYGAVDSYPSIEFKMDTFNKKTIKDDPQLIKFEKVEYDTALPIDPSDLDDRFDNAITIYDYYDNDVLKTKDSRWLRRPNQLYGMWETRELGFNKNDLPCAGPIKLNEIDYTAKDENELLNLATTKRLQENTLLNEGERVWLYDTGAGDWTVLRVSSVGRKNIITDSSTSSNALVENVNINTVFDQSVDCCTGLTNDVVLIPNQRISLSDSHNISSDQYFIIQPNVNTNIGQAAEILGTYKAEIGTNNSLIYYSTGNQIENNWSNDGPEVYSYFPVRFDNFGNTIIDNMGKVTSHGVADSEPVNGWISDLTEYRITLDASYFTGSNGSIKLIDKLHMFQNTIKNINITLNQPWISNATMSMTIGTDDKKNYYNVNQYHITDNDLKTQFHVTDNKQIGSNARQVYGSDFSEYVDGAFKIGSNITGTINSISLTIPEGQEFAYSQQTSFSIGTLNDPNYFVSSENVILSQAGSITVNTKFNFDLPTDIYIYFTAGNVPDQTGNMFVNINYDRKFNYTDKAVITTNKDLNLYYDFGLINSQNIGSITLKILVENNNHDIIWVDENQDNIWGVYKPSTMISQQSVVGIEQFAANSFVSNNVLANDAEYRNKHITRIEVDIDALSTTALTFNGGFDYSDINNTNTITHNGTVWKYNELVVEGMSDSVDGYISDITLSIATSAEFIRPSLDIFRASTDYKANDLICVNGLIYKAKQDFTSGTSLDENDWLIMPKLLMSVGTLDNPELVVDSSVVNLAVAGDIILEPNVKKVSSSKLYVFYSFNDYNVNNNSTSSISITGLINAFATITVPGTNFPELLLVDELKSNTKLIYSVGFNYDVGFTPLQIGVAHFGSSTGIFNIRVITWDKQWTEIRTEQVKINPEQIETALIYNIETNSVERYLSYHDPFKGYIVGEAMSDVWYKNIVDPAKYTHSTATDTSDLDPEQSWGFNEIGRVWWDTSTTRVLDYEIQNDQYYTWKNWGGFAPGTSIDVYEWVRSPVPPAELSTSDSLNTSSYSGQLDGQPYNNNGYKWVERVEYDKTVQDWKIFYYFWMKNKQTVPSVDFRKMSVYEIAEMIRNPSAAGVPWFAITNNNSILVGSLKNFAISENTVLQINWKTNKNDGNIHNQWIIARENDNSELIDNILWNKMEDSLVGWDKTHPIAKIVPDTNLSVVERCGNFVRPRQSWFKPEANNQASRMARRIFVDSFNYFVSSYELPFVDSFGDFVNELNTASIMPLERTKQITSMTIGVNDTGTITLAEDVVGMIFSIKVEVIEQFVQGNPYITIGTDENPELYVASSDVNLKDNETYMFVDKVYLTEKTTIKLFTNWNSSVSGLFNVTLTLATEHLTGWDYSVTASDGVTGREKRDLLQYNPGINDGDRVLITNDTDAADFWTMWEWSNNQFNLVDVQTYRISTDIKDFMEYVNWYKDGYSSLSKPLYYYETYEEMNNHSNNWADNSLIQVNDDIGRWSWYNRERASSTGWAMVGREYGSIKLSDAFYTSSTIFAPAYIDSSEWVVDYDTIVNRDGSRELTVILDTLRKQRDATLMMMQNRIFFALVKFVHSEQHVVDWAFKTSFIYITGLREALTQLPIQQPDNTDDIIDYIDEVKPYHTKIRDFVRSMVVEQENANMFISDFDKPQTWDYYIPGAKELGNYKVANKGEENDIEANAYGPFDETTQEGKNELVKWRPWTEWWNLYNAINAADGEDKQYYINQYVDLVRTFEITIKFDRLDTKFDKIFEKDVLSDEDIAKINASGAVARMYNAYPDFKKNWKYYKSLISGATFRGVVVDGGPTGHDDIVDFEHNMWDMRLWNTKPWDQTQYSNVYPTTSLKRVGFEFNNMGDVVVIDGETYYRKPIVENFVGIITKYVFIIVDDFTNGPTQKAFIGTDDMINKIMDAQDITYSGSWVENRFVEFDTSTDIYLYIQASGLTSGSGFAVLHAADKVDKITYITELSAGTTGSENIIKMFTGTITEIKLTIVEEFDNDVVLNIGSPMEHNMVLKSEEIMFNNEQFFSVNFKQRDPMNINTYFDFTAASVGKLRLEIKTESVQQQLNDIGPLDPFYDVSLNGGKLDRNYPYYDPQTDDTPNILVEGGRLIQPFVEQDKPEELIDVNISDVISLTVHTNGKSGAPVITTQRFFGDDISGPYNIFNYGQSRESVMVYKNGILLEDNVDYYINWQNQTLWFGTVSNPVVIGLNDDILVSVYSSGGAKIVEQKTIVAPSVYAFDFKLIEGSVWNNKAIPEQAIVVTINGSIVDSFDFLDTEKSVVNIVPTPQTGDLVTITLFDSEVYSFIRTQYDVVTQLADPYAITIENGTNSTVPEFSALLVYKNGQRLGPPDTDYFEGNGINNKYIINKPHNINNVKVLVNDSEITDFGIHPVLKKSYSLIKKYSVTGTNIIDINDIVIPSDVLWENAAAIPEQAMWMFVNGVQVNFIENNNGLVKIKEGNIQIQPTDSVELYIYDWFVTNIVNVDKTITPTNGQVDSINSTYAIDNGFVTETAISVVDNGSLNENIMSIVNCGFISETASSIAQSLFMDVQTSMIIHSNEQVFVWINNVRKTPAEYYYEQTSSGYKFTIQHDVYDYGDEIRIIILENELNNKKVNVVLTNVPEVDDQIEIITYENYDYDVVGNLLTIYTGVVLNDKIEIITFAENESMGTRTEVFEGTTDGRYILSQKPYSNNSIWAAVDKITVNGSDTNNGITQYPTKDFKVEYKTVEDENGNLKEVAIVDFGVQHARKYDRKIAWGSDSNSNPVNNDPIGEYTWDTNGLEDEVYDAQQSEQLIQPSDMIFDPGWDADGWDAAIEYERDRVWITSYAGKPTVPDVAWKMFKTNIGYWETTRISERHKTILRKPVYVGSRTIELDSNPVIATADLPENVLYTPTSNNPGIIWIGSERIEYNNIAKDIDVNTGRPYWTLSNITRGTLGTSYAQHMRYKSQNIVGDGSTTKFVLDNEIKNMFDSIIVYGYEYEVDYVENSNTYYKVSSINVLSNYTIIREDGLWKIKFTNAPAMSVIGSTSPYYPSYNPDIVTWDSNNTWTDGVWDDNSTVPNPQQISPVTVNHWMANIVVVGHNDLITDYNNTLQYNVGEVVINGNHKIPGGYKWTPTPNGIQLSDTSMAKYLIEEPGTWLS